MVRRTFSRESAIAEFGRRPGGGLNPSHRADAFRPLRVLYVGPLPPMRGGDAMVGMRLLRQLQTDGLTVHALAPLPTPQAGKTRPSTFLDPRLGLNITRYPMPTHSDLLSHGSSDAVYRSHEGYWVAELLPELLRSMRPDVVLIGRESLAWHVPAVAGACGVPTVLQVHGGMTLHGLLGHLDGFPASELLQQVQEVDLIVAVASHLAVALRGLALPAVEVVANPVDLTLFAPRPASVRLRQALEIPAQSTIVLHVSNLRAVKRPLDLVGAAEILARRGARMTYVIVGDGMLRGALEETVDRSGLAMHFRFVGWIDDDRVPDYINLADLVVLPSETEGQSLAALETQACGRVLLASDIPAFREIVTDGETGLLFRQPDIADLAAKLLAAAESPELRVAIGTRARTAVASHGVDQTARRYAALLREVVSVHARSAPALGE